MSTFLDSTFLIDIVEDPAATRKAAQDLEDRDEGVVTGALNLFEVFRGVHSLRDPTRRRKLQQQYEAVIQSTMVMDLSREDALRAAGWSGALLGVSPRPPPIADCEDAVNSTRVAVSERFPLFPNRHRR